MTSHWEHFEHGADVGVRGIGPSKSDAFEQAALALTAVMSDPTRVNPRQEVHITCEAGDDELLLVSWLNALIYQMAVRGMLFGSFRVGLHGHRLTGTATGEAISLRRHRPAVEVKGATFTGLRVARAPDGLWTAQTVVDL